ncbi:hypothetical protein [Xenorhabdus hominickii]|uniref:Integrase n=1 Tax=Xenorhabdus hominickii TaxID=351679 RepID=A0A1V0M4T6_XENHO|nr:hypothetical protein [Xenorhabdus hominickii]ARD69893.1 hypothetical protein [Xenorhabdus hominickii]PHM51441.1 hypothetical protein Xhom_04921 [Xenorhabdus hominickii]
MDEKDKLQNEFGEILNKSRVVPEEKLAVMMMFGFQFMSLVQADIINMRAFDGRVLTLKLESKELKH